MSEKDKNKGISITGQTCPTCGKVYRTAVNTEKYEYLPNEEAIELQAELEKHRWIPVSDMPEIIAGGKEKIPQSVWSASYHTLDYEDKIPKIMTSEEIWLDEDSEVEWYMPITLPESGE